MAGPYYVDDGGDGTTESSWATADTSINDLDTEYTFASGEIVYFGHDHVCQATNAASLTITGPISGLPVSFISATQGSSPAVYQASTTAQIDTSEGAYQLIFDGSFALYGMSVKAGSHIQLSPDADETFDCYSCRFALGANSYLVTGAQTGAVRLFNTTIDLTADGTTGRTTAVFTTYGMTEIIGASFVNPAYRTGYIISSQHYNLRVSGADFSGFTNATTCELLDIASNSGATVFNNCDTVSSPTFMTSARPRPNGYALFTNVGPSTSRTSLVFRDYWGDLVSTTAIYRSGGGTVEGDATSWLVTTQAGACEASPFKTPWAYDKVASTGSKTFTVYITNDTADFTNAEVWLEVEYLGTTAEALFSSGSDARTNITTTAAAQTDDVTSTWNGTGPSYTYKQSLAVTSTVNVAGLYRWRVCCGVASIASSRYFYIDPLCTVS